VYTKDTINRYVHPSPRSKLIAVGLHFHVARHSFSLNYISGPAGASAQKSTHASHFADTPDRYGSATKKAMAVKGEATSSPSFLVSSPRANSSPGFVCARFDVEFPPHQYKVSVIRD
jgi:hypothetical protein